LESRSSIWFTFQDKRLLGFTLVTFIPKFNSPFLLGCKLINFLQSFLSSQSKC
jgi:hypothetical protein